MKLEIKAEAAQLRALMEATEPTMKNCFSYDELELMRQKIGSLTVDLRYVSMWPVIYSAQIEAKSADGIDTQKLAKRIKGLGLLEVLWLHNAVAA